MATSDPYESVLAQAQNLSPDEQLRLLRQLELDLAKATKSPTPRGSILALQGLGAEIWLGVDPEQYVRRERSSWPG